MPKFIAYLAVAAFVALFAVVGTYLYRSGSAQSVATVTLQNSKLYVNGQPFAIRGVEYNPVATGTDQIDIAAPANDIPKIKALGANTVGTYILGKSEWAQWSDLTTGDALYQSLMPAAEQAGLKVIVGYFSNETIDWTNTTRVAKVTNQYQELVNKAKLSSATLMYMVGNETFEKLPNDTQRNAYAKWLGDMANWTHQNDTNHPVFYSDRGDSYALPWLKAYAPNLDLYGVNNYSFTSASSLKTIVNTYANAWPGKPIMIHEWGADSLNVATGQEDTTMQSNAVTNLAQAIDTTTADAATPLIGGLNFELTDEWRFVGSVSTQDKDTGWGCASCGDGRANEDYWGLLRASPTGNSASRAYKPAYYALQTVWKTTSSTPPPLTGTANLALNRPVTVSSLEGTDTGSKAVDGNSTTRWWTKKSSVLSSEWIKIDLGTSKPVSKVVLNQGDRWAKTYTIKVSPDGVTWTNVASSTSGIKGIAPHTFSTVSTRYVMMESTAWYNTTDHMKLLEFEVY